MGRLRIALALIVLIVPLVLLVPGAAVGARVEIVPESFSPRTGAVTIEASLSTTRRVGVALATPRGRRLGWLSPPAPRRVVSLRWYGRLGDALVPDGRYRVEIVRGKKTLGFAAVVVDGTAPRFSQLRVINGGRPFLGDRALLSTASPNGDGLRDQVAVTFDLSEAATVRLEAVRTRKVIEDAVWSTEAELGPGRNSLTWKPAPGIPPRTYLLRLTVVDRLGNRRVYGGDRRLYPWLPASPVVRVLGVDAGFTARSYAPGQRADLVVESDATSLTVEILRSGPESQPTYRNDEMNGVGVTDPATIDWSARRNTSGRIRVRIGDWPSGLYFARVTADDGRVGYAPFILRPGSFGARRVAIVLPTNTWQAYNYRDLDGDGWGDTWYAGGDPPVDLGRPFLNRGVPFRFKSYDLGFLHWLHRGGKEVEFLAEEDVERFRTGDQLAATYDLVIFPGHSEYVTEPEYDIVQRYRDLGGNLWFLSANNFFWAVERRDRLLARTALWRDLGRPEAALIGVQYLANDDGSRQGSFVVAPDSPGWAWEGTSVGFGERFGNYGIEIDARAPSSPPGVQVLATIPDVFGPGRSAEMTYYETPAGAKVFAAGVLNFGGSAERWAVDHLLENLWARTAVP